MERSKYLCYFTYRCSDHAYDIGEITTFVPGLFSPDDQIKTRTGAALSFATHTGSEWSGDLEELVPGIGYQVKVAQALSFCYGTCPP